MGGQYLDGDLGEAYASLSEFGRALLVVLPDWGRTQRESGGTGTDPIDALLRPLDWNEQGIQVASLYIENSAADPIGSAGAVASTEKAIDYLKRALREHGSGDWTGKAADGFGAFTETVVRNLEEFKDALHGLATAVYGEHYELGGWGSCTHALKTTCELVKEKAQGTAAATARDTRVVLSTGDVSQDAMEKSRNALISAYNDFSSFMDQRYTFLDSYLPVPPSRWTTGIPWRVPSDAAREAMARNPVEGFSWSRTSLVVTMNLTKSSLAQMRVTKENLEKARVTGPFLGITAGGSEAIGEYTSALNQRLQDAKGVFIPHIIQIFEGLDATLAAYEEAGKLDDGAARAIESDYFNRSSPPPPENDPYSKQARGQIDTILKGDWQGEDAGNLEPLPWRPGENGEIEPGEGGEGEEH